MMGNYYGDMLGLGGGIFMLVFWLALILFIVSVFRSWGESGSPKKTALDFLEERYAKGEASKEEFEAKKKDLSK